MSNALPDRYRFVELFGQVPWFATLPEEARWSLAWYVVHWRPSAEGRRAAAAVAGLSAVATSTATGR